MNEGKIIVERIDALLAEKKLKRKDLAAYAGISVQAFTNWTARGNCPAADVAIKIAKTLDVSVEYLVTGEDPVKPDLSGIVEKLESITKELKGL